MDTPLYDELVVKYYLSKGIVPFTYPHEFVRRAPKGVSIKVGIGKRNEPVDPTAGVTFDLLADDKVVGTVNPERLGKKYDYFRL